MTYHSTLNLRKNHLNLRRHHRINKTKIVLSLDKSSSNEIYALSYHSTRIKCKKRLKDFSFYGEQKAVHKVLREKGYNNHETDLKYTCILE